MHAGFRGLRPSLKRTKDSISNLLSFKVHNGYVLAKNIIEYQSVVCMIPMWTFTALVSVIHQNFDFHFWTAAGLQLMIPRVPSTTSASLSIHTTTLLCFFNSSAVDEGKAAASLSWL